MFFNGEETVVDQQVTGNIVNAGLAYSTQHLPHALGHKEWVTTAPDQQVTIEGAAVDVAERVNIGLPRIRWPEHIERHKCRQQLDCRARVFRHQVLPAQNHLSRLEIFDVDAERVGWNVAEL